MRIRALATATALAVGIAAAMPGAARAQTTAELALRIERLETQVREMTGLIDALTFQLQQLQQMVDILRADNEVLYQLLGGTGATPPAAPTTPTAPAADTPVTLPPDTPLTLGTPPTTLGVVPATPGAGAPLDLTQALRPDGGFNITNPPPANPAATPPAADPAQPAAPTAPAAPPATVGLTGNPQADYDTAYRSLLDGDYAVAEQAFRSFIAAYPGNGLVADAQFWVAESLFARALYEQAAAEYLDVYIRNRNHTKAPEMLLKLGMSLVHLNQRASACDTFRLIQTQYPNVSSALRQRLATEMANAGC